MKSLEMPSIRLALKLSKCDKIYYEVKTSAENEDPVVGKFLELLEANMQQQPERITALQPELADQLNKLTQQVLALKEKDPVNYTHKNATKRLAAIRKLILEVIPQDPTLAEYRQGKTLGDKHKHWFRAKFFQQYRLFFRFHASSKTLIYA